MLLLISKGCPSVYQGIKKYIVWQKPSSYKNIMFHNLIQLSTMIYQLDISIIITSRNMKRESVKKTNGLSNVKQLLRMPDRWCRQTKAINKLTKQLKLVNLLGCQLRQYLLRSELIAIINLCNRCSSSLIFLTRIALNEHRSTGLFIRHDLLVFS